MPQSDSSSSASPVSDPEDLTKPRHKKKSLKSTSIRSRHHPGGTTNKPKAIYTPIPTVPKGFVPSQHSGDSGIFSGSRNRSLNLEEISGVCNCLKESINFYIFLFNSSVYPYGIFSSIIPRGAREKFIRSIER